MEERGKEGSTKNVRTVGKDTEQREHDRSVQACLVQQRICRDRWCIHRGSGSVCQGQLGRNQETNPAAPVQTAASKAGRDTKAKWWKAKARDTNCHGQNHPAGSHAGHSAYL